MWNPFSDTAQGAVKGLGEAIKDAVSAFKADPTEVAKLQAEVNRLLVEHETKLVESVNMTMREEAKSDHWMQWSWRPTFGFSASFVIVNNYGLLPYFEHFGLKPIVIPPEVWAFMTVVLGVAAYTRGQEKLSRLS